MFKRLITLIFSFRYLKYTPRYTPTQSPLGLNVGLLRLNPEITLVLFPSILLAWEEGGGALSADGVPGKVSMARR